MAHQRFAQTPSAFGFPLLIKGLLESGVTTGMGSTSF